MKQDVWRSYMYVKKPDDSLLEVQHQQLKAQYRKAADEAHRAQWEDKAGNVDKVCEAAVKDGRDGYLLKDLKLIQWRQNLRASTALLAADGRSKLIDIAEQMERWREQL